jgi:hypothetical protein
MNALNTSLLVQTAAQASAMNPEYIRVHEAIAFCEATEPGTVRLQFI